jgi:hypothetical protein
MLYGYVALLFVFFYVSRFLNENYLGYLASFLALAIIIDKNVNIYQGGNNVTRERFGA